MKGELLIKIKKGSKVVRKVKQCNILTTQAYTNIARLLAGSGAVLRYIDRMQFGTGITVPTEADNTLQAPLTPIKDIVTIEHPTDNTVKYIAYLLVDELNGFPLTEAGLLDTSGRLIARSVFAAQLKDADHVFEFSWTLTF